MILLINSKGIVPFWGDAFVERGKYECYKSCSSFECVCLLPVCRQESSGLIWAARQPKQDFLSLIRKHETVANVIKTRGAFGGERGRPLLSASWLTGSEGRAHGFDHGPLTDENGGSQKIIVGLDDNRPIWTSLRFCQRAKICLRILGTPQSRTGIPTGPPKKTKNSIDES